MAFYVHKIVLSLASPFFRDMFSLTQPEKAGSSVEIPIIPIEEHSIALDYLLRLCYPIKDPVVSTLADVQDVLAAAVKYQMGEAIEIMTKRLMTFTANESLQVFAIACRLKLEDEARTAAKVWKLRSVVAREGEVSWSKTAAASAYCDAMKDISAGQYFRLLEYFRTGQLESVCSPSSPLVSRQVPSASSRTSIYDCEDGDLILRSLDGQWFYAYKLLLSMAVPAILQLPSTPSSNGTPTIEIPYNSRVLAKLLAICQPLADTDLETLDIAESIWRAGCEYDVPRMCEIARSYIKSQISSNPLATFFVASRCGFKQEILESLRSCVSEELTGVYCSEMEDSPAEIYHHLLKCRHAYRQAVRLASADVQRFPAEQDPVDLQWMRGGMRYKTSASLPATIFAPLVERSLRHSQKFTYKFNVRDLIDQSVELEIRYNEELDKVSICFVYVSKAWKKR